MYAVTGLLAVAALAANAASEELLDRARRAFDRGVAQERHVAEARRIFAGAADDFEQLRRHGVHTPALYLALGNAEALAGRWPRAIRAYHCGLQLDPNDAALRDHLDYARGLVNYPADGRGRPAVAAWPAWLHRPTAGQWRCAAATAYALAWLAGGLWYARRRTPALVGTLVLVLVAAGAGLGDLVADGRAEYHREHPLVIVAADTTPLHRGNGPSYPLHADVPRLPAGLEARRLRQRGSWLQIQLATGEVGWVRADRVLLVAADATDGPKGISHAAGRAD